MKKLLFLVVCCLCLTGCENNWEDIISIESSKNSEIIYGNDYTIIVKGKTNKIYNVCIEAEFETYRWYSENNEEITGTDTLKKCKEVKYKETVEFVFYPKFEEQSVNTRHKIKKITYNKVK